MPAQGAVKTRAPAEVAATEPHRPSQGFWSAQWRDLAWLMLTAVGAIFAFAIDSHLWDAHLHVPLYGVGSDITFVFENVKTMVDHGWFWTNSNVGAPAGQELYDFAALLGDLSHFAIMRVLSLGSSDPVAIVNAYYVLGYGFCAGAAFVVLRMLGFTRGVAATCGVLFGVLPYHMLRNESHLFLGEYWSVPFDCWLILAAVGRVPAFTRRPGATGRVRPWLTRTSLLTVGLAVLCGITDDYYASFTLILVVTNAVLAALARRDLRILLTAGAICVSIAGAMVACQIPAFVYQASHGKDAEVAKRLPSDSEVYGLKVANLVLPRPDHRIPAFSHVGIKYSLATVAPSEGPSPSLGSFGTIGLIVVVGAFLLAALGGALRSGRAALLRDSGLAALMAILYGTVGGGSAIIAVLVTAQIRGWNRISTLIAFFALIGLAGLLSFVRERAVTRGGIAATGSLAVLPVVAVLGVLDQTSSADVPDYATARSEWTSDARFVRGVESEVPRGSMILQFPYVPFPENPPVVNMLDYDEFRGYLHSDTLRWSYGQMKGRLTDWGSVASGFPIGELLPAAVGAGFQGIYIDRWGYLDRATALIAQIKKLTGSAGEIGSENGRLDFIPLASYAQRLRARVPASIIDAGGQALVKPVQAQYGPGFYDSEYNPQQGYFHWAQNQATLTLANPEHRARTVRLTFALNISTPPAPVRISGPGFPARTVTTGSSKAAPIAITLTVPPAGEDIHFATNTPSQELPTDLRDLHFQLESVNIVDFDIERLRHEAAAL